MCRVHTERFFYLCAHYQWIETLERSATGCGPCKRNAFRMELWRNQVCRQCHGLGKSFPGADGRDPKTKKEQAAWQKKLIRTGGEENPERVCWLRRYNAYEEAVALSQKAQMAKSLSTGLGGGGMGYGLNTPIAEVNVVQRLPAVLWRSIPLDFYQSTYIVDTTEFLSPQIIIVPPGTISKDLDKCSVCWGSLTAKGDEACQGGGARMLLCGHLYGKMCISQVFRKWNMCPYCTREYTVRRSTEIGFVQYTLFGPINTEIGPKWVAAGRTIMWLLAPMGVAVTIIMGVGAPGDRQHHMRQASLPKKISIGLLCLVMFPYIYGFMIYGFWTGELQQHF